MKEVPKINILWSVYTSFNITLNFKAIINRLDFTYLNKYIFWGRISASIIRKVCRRVHIKLPIDTGVSKNYMQHQPKLGIVTPVKRTFLVRSLHGFSNVEEKCLIRILDALEVFLSYHYFLHLTESFVFICYRRQDQNQTSKICCKINRIHSWFSGAEILQLCKCKLLAPNAKI